MVNKTMIPLISANRICTLIGGEYNNFQVSINTPDTNWTDTTLSTVIPVTGTETITDCSTATGWTTTAGSTLVLNTVTFKPDGGTDGALSFTKSSTSILEISATKTTSALTATLKNHTMWLYVKDATTLAKLNATTAALIRYGSASTAYLQKVYGASSLSTGWNFLTNAITTSFTTTGTVNLNSMTYTYFATNTTTVTDTLASGDLIFDAIRLASSDDYSKAIDSVSYDLVDGSVSVIGKLSVTDANGFLLNGVCFRTSSNTMTVKSKFPENSKDSTDLFKITSKLKFRNINQV